MLTIEIVDLSDVWQDLLPIVRPLTTPDNRNTEKLDATTEFGTHELSKTVMDLNCTVHPRCILIIFSHASLVMSVFGILRLKILYAFLVPSFAMHI